MGLREYRRYMIRAERARTVAELRRIADEAKAAHPDDAEAELIDHTCFTFATALIERQAERRTKYLEAAPASFRVDASVGARRALRVMD